MCAFGPNVKVQPVTKTTYGEPTEQELALVASVEAGHPNWVPFKLGLENKYSAWTIITIKPNGKNDLVIVRRSAYTWSSKRGVTAQGELATYSVPRDKHSFQVGNIVGFGSTSKKFLWFRSEQCTMHLSEQRTPTEWEYEQLASEPR